MLDILEHAKSKLKPNAIADVEAAIEFALGGVAEDYFAHSSTRNWREAYNYAASCLAPSKDGHIVIQSMKKEFPPILSVHAKADIKEVGRKHFLALLKLKDPQAVIQGLTNLGRWRGQEDEELGSWTKSMITSLVNEYNLGMGPNGKCICNNCISEAPHVPGVPCNEVACPDCGEPMARGISQSKLYAPADPQPVEDEDEDEDDKVVDVELHEGESPKPLEAENEVELAPEGEFCQCPECGYTAPFSGSPCESIECPKCPGVMMQFVNTLKAQVTDKNISVKVLHDTLDKSIKALHKIKKKN
jgi:hypothetical protein